MNNDDVVVREYRGHGMDSLYMARITVDGITTENERAYGYEFFGLKEDYWPDEEELYDTSGYLDDRPGGNMNVFWESPYMPIPFSEGQIDEDAWIREGIIRAENTPEEFL